MCETCGQKLADCVGHFGYIRLVKPVFHIGYFRNMVQILQCICKKCSAVLLPQVGYAASLDPLKDVSQSICTICMHPADRTTPHITVVPHITLFCTFSSSNAIFVLDPQFSSSKCIFNTLLLHGPIPAQHITSARPNSCTTYFFHYPQGDKATWLRRLRRPATDHLARARIFKTINDKCKRQRICFVCKSHNSTVKYAASSHTAAAPCIVCACSLAPVVVVPIPLIRP